MAKRRAISKSDKTTIAKVTKKMAKPRVATSAESIAALFERKF
jgi:hypothetical protein